MENMIWIFIQMIAFTFFQVIIYCCKSKKKYELSVKNWLCILFISEVCFISGLILIVNINKKNKFFIGEVITFVALFIINFLSYYFCLVLSEKRKMEIELAAYKERYQNILQTREEIESLRHDINNHFSILNGLCQEGQKGKKPQECMNEIEKYLKKIGTAYYKVFHNISSENLVVDSLIKMKTEYAASKGIGIETKLYIPSDMNYDSLDLMILLGNLLDNAIEACERMKIETETKIVLKIGYKMTHLIIHIENPYNGRDKQSGNSEESVMPQTIKENKKIHGIGMKNIKKVVEKYHGIIKWRSEQGMFFMDVLLFGFDKREIKE